MKLTTAIQMQGLDRRAIDDFGIPGVVLMENAGLGTVHLLERACGSPDGKFAMILVGPGNNGGDGFVIGRHLHQKGCDVLFFLLCATDALRGDARVNYLIIEKIGLPVFEVNDQEDVATIVQHFHHKRIHSHCYAIVDALFGTGLQRELRGKYQAVVDLINSLKSVHNIPVVAVDCPSGLDVDNGKILGAAVKADFTATYGWAKPGHFIGEGYSHTGQLTVIDIGIPPEAAAGVGLNHELVDEKHAGSLISCLKRENSCHKGSNGHLLVVAGSTGKTGAAILSVEGATRSGSGLVTLVAPEDLNAVYENRLIEAMTYQLPLSKGSIEAADLDHIVGLLSGKTALVVGPGLGTSPTTSELVIHLYTTVKTPMVVDADGLNILAENPECIKKAAGPRIFTPHPGEMSRLLGSSVNDIQSNRLEAVRAAVEILSSENMGSVVILKGAQTITSTTDNSLHVNWSGNPGMAAGGMGDVLSGIVGGLICQGMSVDQAGVVGVYLHGKAADMLYQQHGAGYTASELAHTVPAALNQIKKVR